MYRLIIVLGWLLCSASGLRAQEPMDFNTINSETYRLYLAGEWDSVIIVGNNSLKLNVDYFYLRMRMGIAFHEKQRFRKAATHFEKALEFSQGDPAALEYLYYARLLGGQYDQASLVRKEFKGELALKLPSAGSRFFDRVGGEYLFCQGLTDNLLADSDALFAGLPPGVQYVTRHYSNASLSLSNRLAPGISLNLTYTYLSKTNHQYYNDGLNVMQIPDQHVYQHQFHFSPTFTTRSGYTLLPMLHYVSVHYKSPVAVQQGFQGGSTQVTLGYLDEVDFVTGMAFRKGSGIFDLHLGAWYATINHNDLVQSRIGLTWYPFANLKFYVEGFLNSQYEVSNEVNLLRIVPELNVGGAVAGKVWLELSGAMGEMTNYLEQNGAIIFNSFSDVIHKKVVLTASLPITEKGSVVYLGGRWTAHQSDFYSIDATQDEVSNSIKYNAISIYGGISWKF